MRIVPRWVHWTWAQLNGYFWWPCPSCGKPFGGHETQQVKGHFHSRPTADNAEGEMICPDCTRRGVGCVAWALSGRPYMVHTGCPFAPVQLLALPAKQDDNEAPGRHRNDT